MSRREWSLFVADMQEAIEKIASYVDAMTFTDFQSDTRTVDAVIWEIVQTDLPHLEKQLAAWLDAKG